MSDAAADMFMFDAQKMYAERAFLTARGQVLYRFIKDVGDIKLDASGYMDMDSRGWRREDLNTVLGHLLAAGRISVFDENGVVLFQVSTPAGPRNEDAAWQQGQGRGGTPARPSASRGRTRPNS